MTNKELFVQAFLQADALEMEKYQAEADFSHEFSEDFEKKMNKLIAKNNRIKLNTRRKISKALIAAIIAITVLFTGIMSVSASREKVVEFVENILWAHITVQGNSAWGEHDGKWYYKTWTGETISPDIKVWLNDRYWDHGKWVTVRKDLVEGLDYELTLGNNVDMGYCRVIITGIGAYRDIDIVEKADKTSYEGISEEEYSLIEQTDNAKGPIFVIRPLGTTVNTLTPMNDAVEVTWGCQDKKMSKKRITGYQIQLSTSKNFDEDKTNTLTVKGYKNTTQTVKNLKENQTYYVRVRTYFECVDGFRAYSLWSKPKTVTTK
ncbi:MAG: fibronectin type III domain-containing protein [Eubacterium sp.]|nr:fibronectin type III domain-containing protein [Eubacterium sp.]MBR0413124.1 fibronectin type III domain-containing protein [Eubacterium sp.]